MSPATLALALPAQPNLEPAIALALAAVVAGVAIAVAGVTLVGRRALRRQARGADALAERLAGGSVAGTVAGRRARVRELNMLSERALWTLPELDRRVTLAARRLAEVRAGVDDLRGLDDVQLRAAVGGIRGTLEMITTVGRIRRMVGR